MADEEPQRVELDEHFVREAIDFFWSNRDAGSITHWMRTHADFERYYERRNKKERDESAS